MIGGSTSREEDQSSASKEASKRSSATTTTTTSSSSQVSWLRLKDPRIVRVSRAFGGKDRHSKVCTVRGLRDRRVRLSVSTAIQLYDLQDRLGLNQPSKVVDWLLDAAKHEIDELPPLQIPPAEFIKASLLSINKAPNNSSTTLHDHNSQDLTAGVLQHQQHNQHNHDSMLNNIMPQLSPFQFLSHSYPAAMDLGSAPQNLFQIGPHAPFYTATQSNRLFNFGMSPKAVSSESGLDGDHQETEFMKLH